MPWNQRRSKPTHFRMKPAPANFTRFTTPNIDSHGNMRRATCGEAHTLQSCRFKNQNCRFCKKQGHIKKGCKKKKASGKPQSDDRHPVRYVDDVDDSAAFGELYHVHESNSEPTIVVPVQINRTKVSMELDTGASVSVMSESTWKEKFSSYRIELSKVQLKTYSGETLNVMGQLQVNVECNDQRSTLPIQIIEGNGAMLLGRNWLKAIKLNWGTIKKVTNDLEQVLHNHNEVFKDELGTMKDTMLNLIVILSFVSLDQYCML